MLRRVLFLKNFLRLFPKDDAEYFVLDEVGFGQHLQTYTYGKIGHPAPVVVKNTLPSNLTACMTISKYRVEGLQFLHKVQSKLKEGDESKL